MDLLNCCFNMLNINPRRLATAFHSLYQEVHTISPLYLAIFLSKLQFIKENAHLYAPLIDHDKTKFSNLVHEDCYQELTKIIGMTPEEYLNSL